MFSLSYRRRVPFVRMYGNSVRMTVDNGRGNSIALDLDPHGARRLAFALLDAEADLNHQQARQSALASHNQ